MIVKQQLLSFYYLLLLSYKSIIKVPIIHSFIIQNTNRNILLKKHYNNKGWMNNSAIRPIKSSASISRGRILLSNNNDDNDDKLISDIPIEERGIGVGIDLGTTNSCIAILDESSNNIPKIIPVKNCRTIPSIVSLNNNNELVKVGHHDEDEEEMEDMENDGNILIYRHVKRIIGQGCTMAYKNINIVPQLNIDTMSTSSVTSIKGKGKGKKGKGKKDKDNITLTLGKQLAEAKENPALLKTLTKELITPDEISSYILKTLFATVEKSIGSNQKVTRAVIGVPAYFNDMQRDATMNACRLAGVTRVRLLREPEAAALAYGIGRNTALKDDSEEDEGELVLVFDLGGGTYDVSMLHVSSGLIEVVATAGNNMLGGSDFDLNIATYFSNRITAQAKPNFLKDKDVSDIMLQAAERVRISLTNNKSLNLKLPLTKKGWIDISSYPGSIIQTQQNYQEGSHNDDEIIKHVYCQFTRTQMEQLNNDLYQQLLKPIREVAIMSQALLPGDARPSAAQAALSMEEQMHSNNQVATEFDDFYNENENEVDDDYDIDQDTLLKLKQAQSMDPKQLRKQQQKARKQARQLQSQEKNYRKQKRNANQDVTKSIISQKAQSTNTKNLKVQDGIHGKPISQVILVGGATRMPAIGRLLGAVTGVIPKKTVHPDEAVALGCAIQAGILDGGGYNDGLQVLTPMQAAIVRAMAKKKSMNIS